MVALFSPFIAGEKPILCIQNGKILFFPKNVNTSFDRAEKIKCLRPLIPYTPTTIDQNLKSGLSPFDSKSKLSPSGRHWLGTDKLGRDVASGMVRGTNIAITIGLLAVLFCFIIGVSIGVLGGYYQQADIKLPYIEAIILGLIFSLGTFYSIFEFLIFDSSTYLWIVSWVCMWILIYVIHTYIPWRTDKAGIRFSIDGVVLKLIEIRKSFPGIFLLLALISIFSVPSVWNIVFIITLLGWADFARLSRAETLGLKNENFIISAKVLGISDMSIIVKHILPNIMPTLIVAICFSIGGAILLESTLSFLGVGLGVEDVSWGKMLAEGRNMRYWWLVFFPGFAIFVLILALNIIASKWQKSDFTITL